MPNLIADKEQQTREERIFTTQQEAKHLERRLLVSGEHRTANSALRSVCFMLHDLAQKYVPSSAQSFEDHQTFLACTKLLLDLGLRPPTAAYTNQSLNRAGRGIALNSFEYRHLKNKTIASLSVIADLIEKPSSVGSADFRRGMKEGFRRASDIAAAFLEEIEMDFESNDQ